MAIVIGHSAYSGANSMRVCKSKAEAVRTLRQRGVTRNAAREAVIAATKTGSYGWISVRSHVPGFPECGNLIEVTNRPDINL